MKGAIRKLRHYPMDPQREALYQVERAFTPKSIFGAQLTRAQALRLIKRVRRQYALIPLKLTFMPKDLVTVDHGRTDILYNPDTEELLGVEFNINRHTRNSLNVPVLLHELAHVVCDQYYGQQLEDHGPEFVGIAMWLYNAYQVIPEDAYRCILRRFKIKHLSMVESSPAALKQQGKIC